MESCRRRRSIMSLRWWSKFVRPRVAVVLFNLGGPDRPEAIRPFLVNLFSDPAILRVPFFVRPFLARRIAASRLGGGPPPPTTTGSSLTAWREAAARAGLVASTSVLCCYPTNAGYIGATSGLLQKTWEQARTELDSSMGLRVLFSAHGLPEAIVQAGDPYQ